MIKINTIEIKTYDSLEYLKTIESKSIGLAIYDAPYFSTGIKEVGDKQWKSEDEYINWCLEIIKETQRTLKDNGSFYWFHNDINIMVEILHRVKHETEFKLENQITWNKLPTHNNFSRVIKTYGDNRRYGRTFTEYIYYFTLQDDYVDNKLYLEAVKEIQNYVKDLIYKYGGNVTKANEFYCNWSGKTGNYRSLFFGKCQPVLYTEQQYIGLCEYIKSIGCREQLKPYREILIMCDKEKYKNLRYPFNQPYQEFKGTTIEQQKQIIKPFSTVWEYDRDDDIVKLHITPKPVEMIKHIIEVSSRNGDTILDIFSGSGTSSLVTLEVGNRNFKGCDMNLEFNKIAQSRLNTYINENNLQDIHIDIS